MIEEKETMSTEEVIKRLKELERTLNGGIRLLTSRIDLLLMNEGIKVLSEPENYLSRSL